MSALIQFQSRNTKYSRNTDQIYFSYIIFENINSTVFTKNDDINFLAKKIPVAGKKMLHSGITKMVAVCSEKVHMKQKCAFWVKLCFNWKMTTYCIRWPFLWKITFCMLSIRKFENKLYWPIKCQLLEWFWIFGNFGNRKTEFETYILDSSRGWTILVQCGHNGSTADIQ